MAPDIDTEYWLKLSLIPGLGNESLRKLLSAFRSPDHIFTATPSDLRQIVPAGIAENILRGANADAVTTNLNWLSSDANHHLVTLADDDYPPLLLQISDPPPIFYLSGRRNLLSGPMLAIVGSRNATAQGNANAESFAKSLSEAGLCIVSGLAGGIDAAAHRGGLLGSSSSIAVIGTGQDIIYPAKNKALADSLALGGAIISEFPLGTPAIASNFPRRNRIISGLSLGCLVVEAAMQSGSHITARLAGEQGREVFAVPGSIHSPLSKGCHALIKRGAKLVETSQDVLEELNLVVPSRAASSHSHPLLSQDAEFILKHLGFDPCGIDTLCARAGLDVESISATLLQLELDGLIDVLPGGLYQRISS